MRTNKLIAKTLFTCLLAVFLVTALPAKITASVVPVNPQSLYRIVINTATEQVAIFYNNEIAVNPIYVFSCSTGAHGNTYTGTYATSDYYDWRNMLGGVWSRYAVRFHGNELMHSVPYYHHSPNSLEYKQYNRLGTPASAGCCRLALSDAKWIYENTTPGTQVDVIHDETIVYPLTQENIVIDVNDVVKRGWDPTDTDPNSPWNAPPPLQ